MAEMKVLLFFNSSTIDLQIVRSVCNIVQEVVTKTIPKKCKKTKELSEEAL